MGAVGIDLVEIARFKKYLSPKRQHVLTGLFTAREIAYAKKYKNAAEHLAGTFAAKEAASKALGVAKNHYLTLEVRHTKEGAPEIWKKNGKRAPVAISITHERTIAAAIALKL